MGGGAGGAGGGGFGGMMGGVGGGVGGAPIGGTAGEFAAYGGANTGSLLDTGQGLTSYPTGTEGTAGSGGFDIMGMLSSIMGGGQGGQGQGKMDPNDLFNKAVSSYTFGIVN